MCLHCLHTVCTVHLIQTLQTHALLLFGDLQECAFATDPEEKAALKHLLGERAPLFMKEYKAMLYGREVSCTRCHLVLRRSVH